LSQVRAEEAESRRIEFRGRSDRPELYPGLMFTVEAHPTLGNVELLVIEVEHATEQPAQNQGETGALAYSNRFRAVPAGTSYRPPRTAPTPRISGVTTAVVLPAPDGPPNEPWLDENGCYRVRMNCEVFTLSSRQILARSVRMAQSSAGSGYGIHFPLRPGTEVVIAFINGDLDRPLIVGAVPNEITPSPVTGAEARVNRIKTHDGVVIEMEDA
jgi:type VI secretion system secreted protein VgrG